MELADEDATRLEQRFEQLAGCVDAAAWDKLIGATSERMLRRLSATGMLDAATPEQLKAALALLGNALVDYTNVAITSIAQAELQQEPHR